MSSYKDVILHDAPLAYWRANEPTPGPSVDLISGLVATWSGSVKPTGQQAGLLVGDPDFSIFSPGANANVTVPGSATVNPPAPCSVELLLKPSSLAAQMNMMQSTVGNTGSGLIVQASGAVIWRTRDGITNHDASSAAGLVQVGNSYHLVGTHDGVNARLYVNGVKRATTLCGYSPATLGLFSWITNGGASVVNGYFDEPAIYGYALSDAQVLSHFNAARMAMLAAIAVTLRTRDGRVTVRAR